MVERDGYLQGSIIEVSLRDPGVEDKNCLGARVPIVLGWNYKVLKPPESTWEVVASLSRASRNEGSGGPDQVAPHCKMERK